MKKLASILIALAAVVGPTVVAVADDGAGCGAGGGGCGGCCGDAEVADLGRLKTLVGEWATADADKDGKPDVVVTYRETAGGSALLETIMPGTPKEMITLYTKDEKGLLLTHYCSVGNQPRMRAKATEAKDTLEFEFCDGTNIAEGAPHMRSLKLTFVDETHIKQEWTMWKDGKLATTITFELAKQTQARVSK